MAIADVKPVGATTSAPIPSPAAANASCPARRDWTVKRLSGDRAQIIAHHGLRVIARDVRTGEADQIVRSVNFHNDLVTALREAAQWLESFGQVCKLPSLAEAGKRARASVQLAHQEVSDG